jgi:exodeoxyribonuclease VII small subunit
MPLSRKPDRTTPTDSGGPVAEPRSFEDAYRELEQVVARLEDGTLNLDEAVRLFDRGRHLGQTCERFIEDAQLRITRLAAETPSPLADL